MQVTKFIVFLFFLSSSIAQAQSNRIEHYNRIDNKIFFYSRKEHQTLDSVTTFVNTTFNTKSDKLRAYYAWVLLNIQYDTRRLQDLETMSLYNVNGSHNFSQEADTVFKRKIAVCEGFCNLVKKFCSASNITCENIAGYTKMPDGKILTGIMHMWNAVKADSSFELLDATWGNGYINDKGQYIKIFSDKYYLSKPENFIKDHYPLDPMWQLLPHPVTRKIFESDSLYFPTGKTFQYTDSINRYLSLPKEEKEYTTYLHYYEGDTDNVFCAKNLDIYINNMVAEELVSAEMYYDDYINFHNNTLRNKPTKANFKKAREYLKGCERNHLNAQKYLSKKRANTADYKATFEKMNEAIISQKKQVKEQMDYLKKMEKTVGVK